MNNQNSNSHLTAIERTSLSYPARIVLNQKKNAMNYLFIAFLMPYSDVKAMTAELQKIGTNINQIAKRVNATGTLYAQDIEDIKGAMAEIWLSQRSILSKAP